MKVPLLSLAVLAATPSAVEAAEQGLASYYHHPRYSGLIAAHRSLPMGTEVRVINLDNGRSAVVRIVDRGPFVRGRVIDVSTAAAGALGFRQAGVARVRLERMSAPVSSRPRATAWR